MVSQVVPDTNLSGYNQCLKRGDEVSFQPDYNNILDAAKNKRPKRLPLYEHKIDPVIMEQILNEKFAEMENAKGSDLKEFFTNYCRFYEEMTYDTVSYEVCITRILPHRGDSLKGAKPGPIQSRADFESFDWNGAVR